MLSLPPCDGPASSNRAGIRTIGMAITAASIPSSASGTRKNVLLLVNIFKTLSIMMDAGATKQLSPSLS
jgi:hypothetical protein